MKLLNWLFPAPVKPSLGANLDTRTPEQRAAQDIHISETVASANAATVEWKEILKSQVRTFGDQDQSGKSDCVAETRRKLKRILFKVNHGIDIDFSSVAFYRKRSNYPQEGMQAADAVQIDAMQGMTLDVLVPSDVVINESAANAIKPEAYNDEIAKVFRISNNDVIFNRGDLDTPAATIQKTRKGVMAWFYFTANEWSAEMPEVETMLNGEYDPRSLRHSVTLIEPALYRGRQGVWIDDSAHFGGLARRFITREFYEARNWYASYPIAFKFEAASIPKPSYNGTIPSLQQCLRYEGFFPVNIDYTNTVGPITTQGIKDFQTAHGLDPVGTVGPKTTTLLKTLYP